MRHLTILLTINFLITFGQSQDSSGLKINQLAEIPDDSSKVKNYIDIANEFFSSDFRQVSVYADSAYQLSKTINYDPGIAESAYLLGESYSRLHKFDESFKYLEEGLELSEKLHLDSLVTLIHNAYGISYNQIGKNDSSLSKFKLVFKRSVERDDNFNAGNAMNNMGLVKSSIGEHDSALVYLEQAKIYYKKFGDPFNLFLVNDNIAREYQITGDYLTSLQFSLKAIEHASKLEDKNVLANTYINTSNLYSEMGIDSLVMEYLMLAKSITDTTKEPILQAYVLGNIGLIHLNNDRLDSAEYYYNKVFEFREKIDDVDYSVQLAMNYGQLLYKQKKYSEALNIQLDLLGRLDKPFLKFYLPYIYYDIASSYEKLKNYNKSLEFAQKSFETVKNTKANILYKDVVFLLAKVYMNFNNYEKSTKYLQEYADISDSLNVSEIIKKIDAAKYKYEIERLEEERELLVREKLANEAIIEANNIRLKNNLIIIIATIIGVIALLVFVYFLRRVNKKLNTMNQMLEEKRNLLEEQNKVKDLLFSIISHDLRSPIASLYSATSLIAKEELSMEDIKQHSLNLSEKLDRTITLMDNLLKWASSQIQGIKPNISEVNIQKVVEEIIKLYEHSANSKGVLIKNEIGSEKSFNTDKEIFSLISRNLISNAIKFTRKGDLIVIKCEEDQTALKVIFADTGIGMEEEVIENIINKKGNVTPSSGTQNERGTGLGLKMCINFIEKIHGKIEVKSKIGMGTSFIVNLPKTT